jgi:hypothetical protein
VQPPRPGSRSSATAYSGEPMKLEDRFVNPLGFQVSATAATPRRCRKPQSPPPATVLGPGGGRPALTVAPASDDDHHRPTAPLPRRRRDRRRARRRGAAGPARAVRLACSSRVRALASDRTRAQVQAAAGRRRPASRASTTTPTRSSSSRALPGYEITVELRPTSRSRMSRSATAAPGRSPPTAAATISSSRRWSAASPPT